jgi:hypothetical protein
MHSQISNWRKDILIPAEIGTGKTGKTGRFLKNTE